VFTLINLALLPVRLALGVTKLGTKIAYRVGKMVGYRRIFVFGAGVAGGLLLAPTPGRQLREKLRGLAASRGGGGPPDHEIGDRVRFELSHSPKTWHLPQPEIDVQAGRVVLTGAVPHETGRQDLGRAAAAVPGVATVDNNLVVTGGNGAA
jgi:hypothetical protein